MANSGYMHPLGVKNLIFFKNISKLVGLQRVTLFTKKEGHGRAQLMVGVPGCHSVYSPAWGWPRPQKGPWAQVPQGVKIDIFEISRNWWDFEEYNGISKGRKPMHN